MLLATEAATSIATPLPEQDALRETTPATLATFTPDATAAPEPTAISILITSATTSSTNPQTNAPSLDPDGRPPDVSADGRWIVFTSYANNLVPDDTNTCNSQWASQGGNCLDVFVYDQEANITQRVSVASNGTQSNGESFAPVISLDGRWVVYRSRSDNLAPGFVEVCATRDNPNDCSGVFVHDLETRETELLVVTSNTQAPDVNNYLSISADGRFVVFWSVESTLVEGVNGANLFVYDRQRAETKVVLNYSEPLVETDLTCQMPEIPGGERWLAFACFAARGIFIYDAETDNRILVNSSDGIFSADEQWIAFSSEVSDFVPNDTNQCDDVQRGQHPCADVFLYDQQTGTIERISLPAEGIQSNANSLRPTISADGRFVAFMSDATNLVTDEMAVCGKGSSGTSCFNIYTYDRQTDNIELISRGESSAADDHSRWPRISADGQWVVFVSWASNLVSDDTNGVPDIFVYDRQTGETKRISTPTP